MTGEWSGIYSDTFADGRFGIALTGSYQARDFGYGQICDLDGTPLAGYTVCDANQEHGIVAHTNASGTPDADIVARFPIGSRLLVLPNHACATGAQFPEYHCRMKNGECQTWPRLYGW